MRQGSKKPSRPSRAFIKAKRARKFEKKNSRFLIDQLTGLSAAQKSFWAEVVTQDHSAWRGGVIEILRMENI